MRASGCIAENSEITAKKQRAGNLTKPKIAVAHAPLNQSEIKRKSKAVGRPSDHLKRVFGAVRVRARRPAMCVPLSVTYGS